MVTVNGQLMEKYITAQKKKLLKEGISFESDKVKEEYYLEIAKFNCF